MFFLQEVLFYYMSQTRTCRGDGVAITLKML